jgi:hypothetical protein
VIEFEGKEKFDNDERFPVSSSGIVGIGRPRIFCGGSERKITSGGFEGSRLVDGMIIGIGRPRILASDTKNL